MMYSQKCSLLWAHIELRSSYSTYFVQSAVIVHFICLTSPLDNKVLESNKDSFTHVLCISQYLMHKSVNIYCDF